MKIRNWHYKTSGILASVMLSPLVQAADINFNGFASIRATSADADGPAATPYNTLTGDGDVSFKDESLFALQAVADLGEGLSATIQLAASGEDDFDLEARWAYLSYDLNDTHTVSIGRFANPLFFQSQYENVGYAHNFATLPRSVYTSFEFNSIEGISLDSTFSLGDYTLDTKVMYGNWNGDTYFPPEDRNINFGLKNEISINGVLSGDWWKIFAGMNTVEIDGAATDSAIFSVLEPVAAQLVATGEATTADLEQLRQAFAQNGKDGNYWYAGFNAEYNNFILDFEFADYKIKDSWDTPNQGYFVALGYRMDSVIVTLHYENFTEETDFSFLNDVSNPAFYALGSGFHASEAAESDAIGINIRYDFHPNAAFKFGYIAGDDEDTDVGDYDILSAGIDVVF